MSMALLAGLANSNLRDPKRVRQKTEGLLAGTQIRELLTAFCPWVLPARSQALIEKRQHFWNRIERRLGIAFGRSS